MIGQRLDEVATVIIELYIEYEASIELDRHVAVRVQIADLGESSITKEYEIRTDGDVAVTARTTQVVIDRETGSTAPINRWQRRIEDNRDSAE